MAMSRCSNRGASRSGSTPAISAPIKSALPGLCIKTHAPQSGSSRSSVREQQGHAARRDYLAGGAAEAEEAQHLAASIGTHDQEIGIAVVGVSKQRATAR